MSPHLDLETLRLAEGAHSNPDEGMCVMEAVAYIAGETFNDHPECVSPVIAAFCRSWNDTLGQDDRDRLLKPIIPALIGTRTTSVDEDTRAWMCLDWLVRTYTPAWLRAAKLDAQASLLVELPEFKAGMDVPSIRPVIVGVRQDATTAWAAAGAAAWAAAGAAAWDAAGAAAWAAAWAAAGAAAWAAAGAAAGAAAWAAAWAAARAAARDALQPVVDGLQDSALDLIRRMCEVGKS